MQITLRLCDSLHAKVREKARELGRSVNSYLVQLIESDLQLPESRVPLETPSVKKSPIMLDAEALLNWSLEHKGEEPNDEIMMEEFGWTERMIPARIQLFKALSKKNPEFQRVREKLRREVFESLLDQGREVGEFKFDEETQAKRFKISKSYFKKTLRDLAEMKAIYYRAAPDGSASIVAYGVPCRNRGCFGIAVRDEAAPIFPHRCIKCGVEPDIENEVLELLKAEKRKLTKQEVAKTLNISFRHLEEALDTLLVKGVLIRDESGAIRPKPENSKPS